MVSKQRALQGRGAVLIFNLFCSWRRGREQGLMHLTMSSLKHAFLAALSLNCPGLLRILATSPQSSLPVPLLNAAFLLLGQGLTLFSSLVHTLSLDSSSRSTALLSIPVLTTPCSLPQSRLPVCTLDFYLTASWKSTSTWLLAPFPTERTPNETLGLRPALCPPPFASHPISLHCGEWLTPLAIETLKLATPVPSLVPVSLSRH